LSVRRRAKMDLRRLQALSPRQESPQAVVLRSKGHPDQLREGQPNE